jgi:hypothetical protein
LDILVFWAGYLLVCSYVAAWTAHFAIIELNTMAASYFYTDLDEKNLSFFANVQIMIDRKILRNRCYHPPHTSIAGWRRDRGDYPQAKDRVAILDE